MAIALGKPAVDGLNGLGAALREWQQDGAPVQLHPGDLGWFWRFGVERTAAAARTWSRDGDDRPSELGDSDIDACRSRHRGWLDIAG